MAKSLRSKRKRKMRAVKREKVYGPKELNRLKQTISNLAPTTLDTEMKDLVTVTSAKEIQEKMDLDSKYDKKTKKDENGHYPPWMHQRAVKKLKTQLKRKDKSKKKKGGKKK